MLHRRHLLQALGASAIGVGLGVHSASLLAAPRAQDTRFLLVFLRGGYDCASLLVPTASSYYYETRPNIAIARPGQEGGALPLTPDWGLHPALAESMLPLYQQRQLAFVPFAGTDDLSRSHFDTQDSIELGQPLGGRRDYRSGFLNRLVAELNPRADSTAAALQPMAFTSTLPLVLRGAVDVPNTALSAGAGRGGVDARQAELIASMYRGTALATPVNEGFATRDEVARTMQGEMEAASRNALSTKGFEGTARRMARLMQSRYQIGFVDVGGWDTHVGQGAATGALANRLEELGWGAGRLCRRDGPRVEVHRGGGHQRVWPHLPRERQPGHGPWPRHGVLGAGRRGEWRPHCGRAAGADRHHAVPEPRLPRAQRLPQCVGGTVRPHVRAERGGRGAGVSRDPGGRPAAGLAALERHIIHYIFDSYSGI